MNYTELLSGLSQGGFTEDQLLKLHEHICVQLKGVRAKKAAMARRQLRVGDRVSYSTDRHGLIKATVTKINRTRAICKTVYGQPVSVPLSMLTVV